MHRITIFLSLAFVAACGTAATVDPPPDEQATAAPGPQRAVRLMPTDDGGAGSDDGGGGGGGAGGGGGGGGGAPSCGSFPLAPASTPGCGFEMECDNDAACAVYPGNYCAAAACQLEGCLRGQCKPGKIQGAKCQRDGECISSRCFTNVRSEPGLCAPEKGPYDFQFP